MRLINADELKTAFPCGEVVRTECVRATIDHMPTIEPERKGKWIPKDDGRYHCSSCDGIAPKGYRWDYCPNCGSYNGAKMEGEKFADVPDTKVEWIPTSKKLPELNQPVLVWTSGDYWLAELHLLDDVYYWDFDTFDLSGEDFNDVVAWMPLPKPYTEDEI